MKIANIVTNVVLGAAVIVLFVFHFTGGEKKVSARRLQQPCGQSIRYKYSLL